MPHHWETGWPHHYMGLWWLVIAGVVLIGVAMLWVAMRRMNRPGESAEDSLKRRYARGEIDEDTYDHMLHELRR